MKKYIFFLLVTIFFANLTFSQNFASVSCKCTGPSTSSCNSICTFSDCCTCWNPNTQTGGCGCYWGVATCRSESNTSNSSMNSTNFGELNPDAKIIFSFEKFNLLFDFFKSKNISTEGMENSFSSVKSKYLLTGQKIEIANPDFAQILVEYSKLIDLLDTNQKGDLNSYIKSLK